MTTNYKAVYAKPLIGFTNHHTYVKKRKKESIYLIPFHHTTHDSGN